MSLPFTPEQFRDVFHAFNEGLLPAHLLVLLATLVIVACASSARRWYTTA